MHCPNRSTERSSAKCWDVKKDSSWEKKRGGKQGRGKERDLPSPQREWGVSERMIHPKIGNQAQGSGQKVRKSQAAKGREAQSLLCLNPPSLVLTRMRRNCFGSLAGT